MPKFMKKGAYLFIYPLLLIAAFDMFRYIYINISSITLAFTTENLFTGEKTFTWEWFEKMFLQFSLAESNLKVAVGNTFKFFVMYFAKTLISFTVGYFLYKKVLGYKIFRVIFYIPCLVSPIILVNIWKNMLGPGGMFNRLWVYGFGLEYADPLSSSSDMAIWIILLFSFWGGFGTDLLIFVGAMNRIPQEVLDAGEIDGCGMGREFFSLIIPLVWETLSTMLMLQSMSLFTATGPILYFTPNNTSTYTLQYYIFNLLYGSGGGGGVNEYNQVAAIGLFFTMIALPLVIAGRLIMSRANKDVAY